MIILENEYEELKLLCDDIEIEFMSTPFDFSAILNDNGCFKISSSDITNKPFIEHCRLPKTYYFIYWGKWT